MKQSIMKAIILDEAGDTSHLILKEIDSPAISDIEILVKVKAISINPVDIKTRKGNPLYEKLKSFKPLILGWDIAGIVEKVGASVTDFNIGDEVFGMVNFPGHGRGYAEYVAAPAAHLAHKPSNISFEEAAASTLAALTAYQALTTTASIQPGQKVLIHAAAGGVGHFAVQLAHHLGAYVIGTASPRNEAFVSGLGANLYANYHGDDMERNVRDVDLCLDTIGGANIDRSIPLMKTNGTIISIPSGLNTDVGEKAEAAGLHGHTFMVQSSGTDMKAIANLLEKGVLKPHVSKIYPFEQMAQAHDQVESNRTVGKVVVTL